jgi:hypothetical protein
MRHLEDHWLLRGSLAAFRLDEVVFTQRATSFHQLLSAIHRESGVGDAIEQRWPDGPWFNGYETEPRWLRLTKSGAELQCVNEGLLSRAPGRDARSSRRRAGF